MRIWAILSMIIVSMVIVFLVCISGQEKAHGEDLRKAADEVFLRESIKGIISASSGMIVSKYKPDEISEKGIKVIISIRADILSKYYTDVDNSGYYYAYYDVCANNVLYRVKIWMTEPFLGSKARCMDKYINSTGQFCEHEGGQK